jgi:hypothetical protein
MGHSTISARTKGALSVSQVEKRFVSYQIGMSASTVSRRALLLRLSLGYPTSLTINMFIARKNPNC